jgi:anti-sigma regulatory factor (Ser/Thr protein kinase)
MGLLNVTIRDNGSGIGKLSHVLGERFDIETNPLGTGLAGVRRVADCFEIESSEKGTRVCVGFRLPSGGDL